MVTPVPSLCFEPANFNNEKLFFSRGQVPRVIHCKYIDCCRRRINTRG